VTTGGEVEKLTVLSLEQALSLSYATQRFVHLGWRVIRVESTPSGDRLPGDPNRYVGKQVEQVTEGAKSDRHAYFIGPNVGKEAIALNLKDKRGQEVLKRLIAELPVDVFASNTLPKRYEELGIDYGSLRAVRPSLIWVGLSAVGPEYPDAPGYDPALQALMGYMDITGDPNGPPMLCGVPFVDLKAGDEVFANVCLALAERARTGLGCRIDVSMAQAAASWLVTTIPLLDLGYARSEITRNANEHREFVPVNVYPTSDGYIYLAIGNDVQWSRLVSIDRFATLASPVRQTNEGRRSERELIHEELGAITRKSTTQDLVELFGSKGLVAAPIHTVSEVVDYPPIRDKLLTTQTPDGRTVRLPPPSVERAHLVSDDRRIGYAPSYGVDTGRILTEAGFAEAEAEDLRSAGVVG
jgi:crotonobetainyl-CoA:carnitine CoA-transferase CaiB-like acyl-CoA transferase